MNTEPIGVAVNRSLPFARAYGSPIISYTSPKAARPVQRSELEQTLDALAEALRQRGFNCNNLVGTRSLQAVLIYTPFGYSVGPGIYSLYANTKIEVSILPTPIEDTPLMLSIFDWESREFCVPPRPMTADDALKSVDNFLAGIAAAYRLFEAKAKPPQPKPPQPKLDPSMQDESPAINMTALADDLRDLGVDFPDVPKGTAAGGSLRGVLVDQSTVELWISLWPYNMGNPIYVQVIDTSSGRLNETSLHTTYQDLLKFVNVLTVGIRAAKPPSS